MKSNFGDTVYHLVTQIPHGRVATYGQIAALAGSPRAARQVGWVLRQLPADSQIPWWRVVNSKGMISIENLAVPKSEQARRLQEEGIGVELRDGNYFVNLEKCLWRNDQAGLPAFGRQRRTKAGLVQW